MIKELKEDRAGTEQNVRSAYEAAQRVQDKLNAVVTFADIDEQLKDLPEEGMMRGVPIALKDNVSTKGLRTTAESNILWNYVPVFNAHIVDKLKEAGAVIIAKTNMDELAMGGTNLSAYSGPTHNPYDLDRMTGGSSGGSAALQGMSGPFGAFFFAPQFDAGFLRVLQQSGKADIRNSASLTVANSETNSYALMFSPQLRTSSSRTMTRPASGPSPPCRRECIRST